MNTYSPVYVQRLSLMDTCDPTCVHIVSLLDTCRTGFFCMCPLTVIKRLYNNSPAFVQLLSGIDICIHQISKHSSHALTSSAASTLSRPCLAIKPPHPACLTKTSNARPGILLHFEINALPPWLAVVTLEDTNSATALESQRMQGATFIFFFALTLVPTCLRGVVVIVAVCSTSDGCVKVTRARFLVLFRLRATISFSARVRSAICACSRSCTSIFLRCCLLPSTSRIRVSRVARRSGVYKDLDLHICNNITRRYRWCRARNNCTDRFVVKPRFLGKIWPRAR